MGTPWDRSAGSSSGDAEEQWQALARVVLAWAADLVPTSVGQEPMLQPHLSRPSGELAMPDLWYQQQCVCISSHTAKTLFNSTSFAPTSSCLQGPALAPPQQPPRSMSRAQLLCPSLRGRLPGSSCCSLIITAGTARDLPGLPRHSSRKSSLQQQLAAAAGWRRYGGLCRACTQVCLLRWAATEVCLWFDRFTIFVCFW
jgi:hypothetical protein